MFEKKIVKTLLNLGRGSIALLLFFLSCTKEPQDIETVQLSDDLYIEVTDTITPRYVVYRLDSFATSNSNMAIIGAATDPYFGRIESQAFCRFKLATNHYLTVGADNEFYDSIALIMRTDSSYYGDTLSYWHISAQKLREDFDDTKTYYNHHSMLAFSENLGEKSVRFRPNVDDSVVIRLDDDWGRELFQLYRDKDERVMTEDAFQRYFRGLRITGTSGNQVVYRFPSSDSTLFIRLYYHEDLGAPVRKYLDYPAEGGNVLFNHISCNVAGTALEDLAPGEEIYSSLLGNMIYLNDLAGIGTKITFPSAVTVASFPNFIRISDAVLNLRPITASFDTYPLIPYLTMRLVNEQNSSGTYLYTSDNSFIQTGNLYIDRLSGKKTGYSYDVSALMRTEMTATPVTSFTAYLQAYTGSGTSFSMNRMVAADNRHPQSPSTLNSQLIFYKK